jgi:hypothetical protein
MVRIECEDKGKFSVATNHTNLIKDVLVFVHEMSLFWLLFKTSEADKNEKVFNTLRTGDADLRF